MFHAEPVAIKGFIALDDILSAFGALANYTAQGAFTAHGLYVFKRIVFGYSLNHILADFLHKLLRVAFAVADFLQLQFPLGGHFHLADGFGH